MSACISNEIRLSNIKEFVNTNFGASSEIISHFYTGKPDAWDDEFSPDTSTSANSEIIDAKYNRIYMKKIEESDVILAIKRFDWTNNTIYTRVDHNKEYTDYRNWYHPESPFYVINSEGNVYKCIANNYDSVSTTEPTGQSTGYIYLGDGYVWKFMFDISPAIESKFLTETWIPVPFDNDKSFAQLQVESNIIQGDIPYIHVDNTGINYTSQPSIQIRGDGTGASAVASMIGNSIDHISMVSNGTGYTFAEVLILGNGTDATATAMISPNDGHGYDAQYELGSFYIEISIELVGDEDGYLPITGSYRNIGIIQDSKNKSSEIITDIKLNALSSINISNSSGTFSINEKIIGKDSLAYCYLYYDPTGVNKYISTYRLSGDFIDNEEVYGQESNIFGNYNESLSSITNVDIKTGIILYKENIRFITRKEIQLENFIFTIEF